MESWNMCERKMEETIRKIIGKAKENQEWLSRIWEVWIEYVVRNWKGLVNRRSYLWIFSQATIL